MDGNMDWMFIMLLDMEDFTPGLALGDIWKKKLTYRAQL